jgi:hypothetical protein
LPVYIPVIQLNLLAPDNPLETLLRNLRLSSRNDLGGIRVAKATSSLAILLASGLGRADTGASGSDLRAAGRAAVSVGNASSGDELGAVSGSDVLGASVVGCDLGHGGSGD